MSARGWTSLGLLGLSPVACVSTGEASRAASWALVVFAGLATALGLALIALGRRWAADRARLLTAQRAVEERARTLERELRDVVEARRAEAGRLAHISHEIRTPMTGLLGMVELLARTEMSEEQRQCVESVRSSSALLIRTVNDLLEVAKADAGRLELEAISFRAASVVEETVHLLTRRAESRGLRLEAALPLGARDVTVVGDPIRLKQILTNLADNALKFTERGGVTIGLALEEASAERVTLRFEVIDTGVGIPPELASRVFDPYTQADASVARRRGGTGLGLHIAQRLVELMGGEISVESEVGRGSRFSVRATFPRAVEPAEEPDAWAPASSISSPGWLADGDPTLPPGALPSPINAPPKEPRGRALLAEDDPINQRVVVGMLHIIGFEVDVAGSGREAVEAFSAKPYDLVLMDCEMPEIDGFEATSLIRSWERAWGHARPRTPVVALTAHTLAATDDRCRAAGMDDVLPKPLTIASLEEKLDRWIGAGQRRPQLRAAPRPASRPQEPVLDESILGGIDHLSEETGEDVLAELSGVFAETVPERLGELHRHLDSGAAELLARSAHTLRSSAVAVGGRRLGRVAGDLEETARAGSLAAAPALVAEVEAEARALEEALAGYVRARPQRPGSAGV